MSDDLNEAEVQCLRDVCSVTEQLGLPILLVGANARRLVFDRPNKVAPNRVTLDWDFAVRVPDWASYAQLRDKLLACGTFQRGDGEQRLVHRPSDIEVDLVPFGGLELGGLITWPTSGSEMNVTGLADAYANAVELELAVGLRVRVATAPLLVALKFFALGDRGGGTDRDILDIWHFLTSHQTHAQMMRLYTDDTLARAVDESFAWEFVGAFLVGYDMARACSPATVERLRPIIDRLTHGYSDLVRPLIRRTYVQEDEQQQQQEVADSFRWLLKGVEFAMAHR